MNVCSRACRTGGQSKKDRDGETCVQGDSEDWPRADNRPSECTVQLRHCNIRPWDQRSPAFHEGFGYGARALQAVRRWTTAFFRPAGDRATWPLNRTPLLKALPAVTAGNGHVLCAARPRGRTSDANGPRQDRDRIRPGRKGCRPWRDRLFAVLPGAVLWRVLWFSAFTAPLRPYYARLVISYGRNTWTDLCTGQAGRLS